MWISLILLRRSVIGLGTEMRMSACGFPGLPPLDTVQHTTAEGLLRSICTGDDMRKLIAFTAVAVFLLAVMPTAAPAQTFEKKNYNYSEWAKGRFSEAVTL